jgi:uncharacterized membrane protein
MQNRLFSCTMFAAFFSGCLWLVSQECGTRQAMGQEPVVSDAEASEPAAGELVTTGETTRAAVDSEGRVVRFNRDIAPIFRRHCLECHGPEDAKADFRIDDEDSVASYVEAGDLESSAMYTDYLLGEDEDMMMPPPSKGGPLSAGELALIRVWIEEGANWPADARVSDASPLAEVPIVVTEKKSLIGRAWAFQGFFHPATIHFPVALLTFGAIFVVLGWKWPAMGTQIPLACLLFGAVSAVGATMMGWAFAPEKGYPGWTHFDMDNEFFWHRWGGVIVTVFSVVMALVALAGLRRGDDSLTKVWKVGLLVAAGMVGAVGHQGGELTYGKDHYPRAFRILFGTEDEESDEENRAGAVPEIGDAAVSEQSGQPAFASISGGRI